MLIFYQEIRLTFSRDDGSSSQRTSPFSNVDHHLQDQNLALKLLISTSLEDSLYQAASLKQAQRLKHDTIMLWFSWKLQNEFVFSLFAVGFG